MTTIIKLLLKYQFIILFLLAVKPIISQEYFFKSYSVQEGLSQSQVNCIEQDQKGFLWVGTRGGGVSVFDGNRFINVGIKDGLLSNSIFSFYELDSKMIIGSDKGISVYEYNTIRNIPITDDLTNNVVYSICKDFNHGFFLGTQQGVYRLDSTLSKIEKINSPFINSGIVRKIICSGNKTYFFNIIDGRITIYDGKEFSYLDELYPSIKNKYFYFIGKNNNDELLAATDDGFYIFNDDARFTRFPFKDKFAVTGIIQDNLDNYWFSTYTKGIIKYDGKEFLHITTDNGFKNNDLLSLTSDNENNIWFGSFGTGLIRYNYSPFTKYHNKTATENGVWSITEFNNKTYIATYANGIEVYSNGYLKNYNTKNSVLKSNNITTFLKDNETLWVGSKKGVYKLINGKLTEFANERFFNRAVWKIEKISKDQYYFLLENDGIVEYKNGKFEYHNPISFMANDVITILVDRNKTLWLGTDYGISILKNDKIINISREELNLYTDVLEFAEDENGDIFVGTGGEGIIKVAHDNYSNFRVVDYISTENGLSHDEIYSLHLDKKNNLWCGNAKGINKIDFANAKIITFGKDDGFTSVECNHHAVYEANDGSMWFGSIDGAFRYEENPIQISEQKPKIYIYDLLLFWENINWEELTSETKKGFTQLPQNIVLDYNTHHLTFEYIGISLKVPEKIRYTYMLEGFDNTWSKPIKETYVSYSNVPPGEYIFKVKASIDGDFSDVSPTVYSFVITPPFWKTTWFILLIIGFITVVPYIIYKRRLILVRKKRDELEQKVNIRTAELNQLIAKKDSFLSLISHDLRSPFTALLGSSKFVLEEFDEMNDADKKSLIENINSSLNQLYKFVENLLEWSSLTLGKKNIVLNEVSVFDVVAEIADLNQRSIREKEIKLHNKVDIDLIIKTDETIIRSVISNLITNAIKFSYSGKNIFIEVDKIENRFRIKVTDEGKGIEEKEISKILDPYQKYTTSGTNQERGSGLGLMICNGFLEKINSKLMIDSKVNKGSCFYFDIYNS